MFSIISREWRAGSLITSLVELIIITLRSVAEYAGHRGKPFEFGLPVAANAAQALLTRSASGKISGALPVSFCTSGSLTLSKTNGISIVCGERSLPLRIGVSQVNS